MRRHCIETLIQIQLGPQLFLLRCEVQQPQFTPIHLGSKRVRLHFSSKIPTLQQGHQKCPEELPDNFFFSYDESQVTPGKFEQSFAAAPGQLINKQISIEFILIRNHFSHKLLEDSLMRKISILQQILTLKEAILFCKFLHENSVDRKNKVDHDEASGKSHKTVISDF